MMNVDDLATLLFATLQNKTDKDGNEPALTDHAKAYARGYINALLGSKVAHSIVTGGGYHVESGGNFENGTAPMASSIISNMLSATMLAELSAAFPDSDQGILASETQAVCAYVMASGKVDFAPGKIVGSCTAVLNAPSGTPPPPSSGVLQDGAGTDGKVKMLVGASMKSAVSAATGNTGPDMLDFYTALCDYTMDNAEATYTSGDVTGTFPVSETAPISLVGGLAVNGVIQ